MNATEAIVDLVSESLVASVLWILPIAGAAVAAALLAGALSTRLGLQDPAIGLVVRAAAVILALMLVADGLGDGARALAIDAFDRLAPIGRGEAER